MIGNFVLAKTDRKQKKYLIGNMAAMIVIFALSRIILEIWHGISVPWYGAIHIVESSDFFSRVEFCIEEIFYIFGGDFFKIQLSVEAIQYLLQALVLVVLFILMFTQRHCWIGNIFYQMCFSVIVVSVMVLMLTDYIPYSDGVEYPVRIMYLPFFCSIILFMSIDFKLIVEKCNMTMKHIKYILLFGSFYMGILTICNILFHAQYDRNDTYRKVADILKAEHATAGFATYWKAYPVLLQSDFSVRIAPIGGSELSYFEWNSKKPDDIDFADFIIFGDDGWGEVTEESITKSVGRPDKIVDVDDLHIFFYHKNIIPYIRRIDCDTKIYKASSLRYSSDIEQDGEYLAVQNGGIQFGPFDRMKEGEYTVIFHGRNLEEVDSDIYSAALDSDGKQIAFNIVEQNDKKIILTCKIEEQIEDAEYRIINNKEEKIQISYIQVLRE